MALEKPFLSWKPLISQAAGANNTMVIASDNSDHGADQATGATFDSPERPEQWSRSGKIKQRLPSRPIHDRESNAVRRFA